MKCPKCGFANRPGARFCKRCGQDLAVVPATPPQADQATCPTCGAIAKPGARFCRQCGNTLSAVAPQLSSTCPNCGATVKRGRRFCRKCGQPLIQEPSPPAAPPAPPPLLLEEMKAHIEGGVSGQVAIGENVLQIGNVYGGVVNVAMPEQKPQPKPRPSPVLLRPRPFPGLLDRETEIGAATATFQPTTRGSQSAATPVEFYGPAGLGKTALLRYLAHHPTANSFPDGIVYLSARDQPLEDLLQSLYDAFYESDIPFKPTDAEIRHDLKDKQALILLDDVGLARDEVETLANVAPACTFILGAPERCLWGEGQTIELGGLPVDDALKLVEQRLGRSLTSQERPAARVLCATLECHPLRLIQAAALARDKGLPLTQVARQVRTRSPVETLKTQVLEALSEPERQILAVLAFLKEISLPTEHLAAITGLADATPALQSLLRSGLVQAHSPRYSLTGDLAQTLQQAWDMTPWAERALVHFTAWAEGQDQAPDHLLEEADAILETLKWAVGSDRWAGVVRLGRAIESALALGGRWGAWAQVLRWILQAAKAVGEQAAEAWAMHQLGTQALCLGDTSAARTALTEALRLREALGDKAGGALTRHNLSLLKGAPPPPRRKPPTPKARAPLAKLFMSLVGVGIIVTVAAIVIPTIFPPPTPMPEPTATSPPPPTEVVATEPPPTEVPPTERPTPPPPEPWIAVELTDGCYREYDRNEYTTLYVEANIEGRVEIWLDDSIFDETWLAPGEVWEIEWTFENLESGGHAFWVTLFDADDDEVAREECPFDVAPPTPTPVTPTWAPTPQCMCGDGTCARSYPCYEDGYNCVADCCVCGDGICEYDSPCYEYSYSCPSDCGTPVTPSPTPFTPSPTPDTTAPPVPIPLDPGDANQYDSEVVDCPVTLRWNPVSDPSGVVYYIWLERSIATSIWEVDYTAYPVYNSELNVPPSNCQTARSYRWRVAAEDGVGNLSNWSDWLYYGIAFE